MRSTALSVSSDEIDTYLASRRKQQAARPKWAMLLAVEVGLLLLAWEALVRAGAVREAFLPPPSAIGVSLYNFLTDAQLYGQALYTFICLAAGILIATVLGVGVGLAMGWVRMVGTAMSPIVWILYATPKAALAPLIILMLGIGPASGILLAVLLSAFPILLNTEEGVRTVSPSLIQAGRVFGTGGLGLATKVVLPATLPFVLVGIRRGVALAFIGQMLGEFLGGNEGIGYVLKRAAHDFRMDDAFAIVVVMVLVSNICLASIDLIRRRLAPWFTEDAASSVAR